MDAGKPETRHVGPSPGWLSPRAFSPAVLTWAATACLSLFLALLVARTDLPAPCADENKILLPQVVSGAKPLTLAWLWEPFTYHRCTAVKLLIYAWGRLTHLNLKAGAFVMLGLCVLAAVLVLRTLAKARGRLLYTDLILPVIMLSPMHLPNVLSMFQLAFLLPYLFLVLFLCRLNLPAARPAGTGAVAAVALVVGSQCSAFGWLVGLMAFLWLVAHSVGLVEPVRRRWGLIAAIVVVGAAYLTVSVPWEALRAYGRQIVPSLCYDPASRPRTLPSHIGNGLSFLALWTGAYAGTTAARSLGLLGIALAGAFASFLAAQLPKAAPERRKRIASVLVAVGVVAGTALLIGAGRESGLYCRYYMLLTPLFLGVYIGFDLLAARPARMARIGLCLAIFGALFPAYSYGMAFYRAHSAKNRDLVKWINAGEDLAVIRAPDFRQAKPMFLPSKKVYLANLDALQHARMALFRRQWMIFPLRRPQDISVWMFTGGPFLLGPVKGITGSFLHSMACVSGDTPAVATSPAFTIGSRLLQFRVLSRLESDTDLQKASIRLVRAETGQCLGEIRPIRTGNPYYEWLDVRQYRGQPVRIQVVDASPNGFIGLGSIFAAERRP